VKGQAVERFHRQEKDEELNHREHRGHREKSESFPLNFALSTLYSAAAGGSVFAVAERRERYASINAACFGPGDVMALIHKIRQIRQIRISPF
jgi:hypothetical protein